MGARCRVCRCLLMTGAWACVNTPCSLLVCVSCMSSTGLPVKCPLPALKGSARWEAQLSQLLVQLSDPAGIPTAASANRLLPSLPLATAIPLSVVFAQGEVWKLGGFRRWQRRWLAAIPGAIIYWAAKPKPSKATLINSTGTHHPLSLPLQSARGILWLTPPLSFHFVGTLPDPPPWCSQREGALGVVHGKGVLYLDPGSAKSARGWAKVLERASSANVAAAGEAVGSERRREGLRRTTASRLISVPGLRERERERERESRGETGSGGRGVSRCTA